MAGTSPIKLGSAATGNWIFETSSNSTTDEYGIQTCQVKAIFPDGGSIFANIPSEGSSVSIIAGTYVPSSFLLDFFEGAPAVEYLEGTAARATFRYKRIDPLFSGRRTVSVDSVLNYQNNALSQVLFWTSGIAQNNVFGFPDPVVTVKYSAASAPPLVTTIYSTPGDFPATPSISIPITFFVSPGGVVSYWDGTTFVSYTVNVATTFIYNLNFVSNPRGWQLVKLKYDPISNRNFFAVEEQWRNFYSFRDAQFVSHTP